MLHALTRWTLPLVAFLVLGPLAWLLTSQLHAGDGSHQTAIILSTSLSQSVLAGLGALALATLVGVAAAYFISPRAGLGCAGLVLVWAAWPTGRVDRIIATTAGLVAAGDGGLGGWGEKSVNASLYAIALEGVGVCIFGAAITWLIVRTPMSRWARVGTHHFPDGPPAEPKAMFNLSMLGALGAAVVAAAVATFVVAQETIKGQTFAAAVCAGVAAAVAGRLVNQQTHAAVFVVAVTLLGVIGPLTVVFGYSSAGSIVHAANAGTLPALGRVLPLDYLAGALVGVPLGLAWANSMVEKHGIDT